jgi:uncharacterized protein YbbC (DUF1343 family)
MKGVFLLHVHRLAYLFHQIFHLWHGELCSGGIISITQHHFSPAIEAMLLCSMLFALYISIRMENFQFSFLKLQFALEDNGTKYTTMLVRYSSSVQHIQLSASRPSI